MSTTGHSPRKIDIDCHDANPVSVSFTCDGREIVSGERYFDRAGGRLRRYQVSGNPNQDPGLLQDATDNVDGVVVSKDGKWIVSVIGTNVVVRNTTTNEVIEVNEHNSEIYTIDVSPDSTRFASGSEDKTVRIFSITTGRRLLGPLQHDGGVFGVKFSPNGVHLATATLRGIQVVWVWDAHAGTKVFMQRVGLSPAYGPTVQPTHCLNSLGWSSNGQRVFAVISGSICGVDISGSGNRRPWYSTPVPASNDPQFFSLVSNGRFIACSAGGSLSFWDASSRTKIGSTITFQDSILSIALSPDESYLACGRGDKKITVYALRDILPLYLILDPSSHLPLMNVSDSAFKKWIDQEFEETMAILSREIESRVDYRTNRQHALANRVLVQVRSQSYIDIEDARKSLSIQPSVISHIALALALLSRSDKQSAIEVFDVCFRDCAADETRFLLLIKAIFLFISGDHEHAIARVNNLIAVADDSAMYDYLQVLGSMYLMKGGSKQPAMQAFERAQSLYFSRRGFHLVTILLIFGRSFEELEVTIRRPLSATVAA